MRPRKEVLLLMRNEEELGRWRMLLEIWGFRVSLCANVDEAKAYLHQFPVHAVMTSIPGTMGADALAKYSHHVLLFDVGANCPAGHAQRVEARGPVLAERVREALKMLTARQRGPGKGFRNAEKALHAAGKKSVESVPATEFATRRRA